MAVETNEMPSAARNRRRTNKSSASSSVPMTTEQKLQAKLQESRDAKLAEARVEAEELKAEGNALFSAGDNLGAVEKFSECILLDSSNHVYYSNRSAANLNLLRTRDAVADAEQCVRIDPNWVKGYSRLGAALLADKQFEQSVVAYKNGLKLDPESLVLIQGLAQAEPAAQEWKMKLEAEEKAAKEAEAVKEAEEARKAEPVIGIDLGTTYSCVAVWGENGVEILTDEDGSRTVPSYVGWGVTGERLIGHRAKANCAKNVKSTVYDAKRIIGQRWGDEGVALEAKRLPFPISEGEDGKVMIEVETKKGAIQRFAPEQISAMVLGKMKSIAEKRLCRPVKKAVITVPAYFNDAQRQATKNAGAIAGLDVLRIINEPTAAALAYGLDQSTSAKTKGRGANVLIFDLGGGTFDVSILNIDDGMFEVKATGGDTRLGGEDFDNTFVDWLLKEFKNKQKLDITTPRDVRNLRSAAERAKRAFSSSEKAKVEVTIDGEEYVMEVERTRFEQMNMTHFNRTLDTVKTVLKDADMSTDEIDDIVLIGGSTRLLMIQKLLSEHFGGRQLCRSINPDEAVAYGAAVQGAILSGVRHSACEDLVLVDVTPLSLGIELQGRQMSVIIPRNSPVPCAKKDTYTTTENYSESLDIKIFEGERPNTEANHLLGEFEITGIERAKKGEPCIEVTFALDSNGILKVTAFDKKTGSKADCQINNACKGLSSEEIDRMVREAEKFAKADEELRKKIELKNEMESHAYDVVSYAESTGKDKDLAMAEDALEYLQDLDVITASLENLEIRHKEILRMTIG